MNTMKTIERLSVQMDTLPAVPKAGAYVILALFMTITCWIWLPIWFVRMIYRLAVHGHE